MADIEQRILQQSGGGGNDEDDFERARARDNEDISSESDDDSSSNINEKVENRGNFHDGPQTGVKGVLADYRHSKMLQKQQREQMNSAEREAYSKAAQRNITDASDRTIWSKDEPDLKTAQSDSDDLDDLDSDGENDRLFAEYRDKRIAEMARAAEKSGLGAVRDVSPDEYVDVVEQHADSRNSVFVILVDESAVSQRFESLVRAEASNFTQTVFLRVVAEECGFCDAAVIPIVLVYRHGDLKHNLVRVVDHLGSSHSFEQRDVNRLLERVLNQ
ncbi:hypothetical protein LPJ53_006107 [Coemansia erecta]|uniref:Phosducin domain-containing protein n=1 Tax=Coemansia erecta TaxID=147472 RepID=A0A9W7XVX9_9FUNG|nr:hypothetical protein LPJ53_006107 [Coemansia erecta]